MNIFSASQRAFFCVETLESRTQVNMHNGGVMDVHDNVTFEANAAEYDGGAVRLPFPPLLD